MEAEKLTKSAVKTFAGSFLGRRTAVDRQRAEEDRIVLALSVSDAGFWDWNIQTGEVYFSPQWLESLGYKRAEVTPSVSFFYSIVHPDDRQRSTEALRDHLEGHTPAFEVTVRLLTESGTWCEHLSRGRVVGCSDGEPARMIRTDMDISKSPALQVPDESARQELEFGQLARNLAHEYNNALTVITGRCELLFDCVQDEGLEEHLGQIRKAGERALGLTSRLLRYGRRALLLGAAESGVMVHDDVE